MSEFWKRKMRTYFSKFDSDHDGVIPKSDWIGVALRYAEPGKVDKQTVEQLKTHFENVWEQFTRYAESDNKEQLTLEMFIDSIGKQRHDPEQLLVKHYSDLIKVIFELMDVNCDGYLQEDEHRNLFGLVEVPDAKESFMAKDTNQDGKLSCDELTDAFWEFLFSEDENNRNTLFMGPLVD